MAEAFKKRKPDINELKLEKRSYIFHRFKFAASHQTPLYTLYATSHTYVGIYSCITCLLKFPNRGFRK